MISPPLTPNAWLRYDVVSRLLDRLGRVDSILEIGCGQGAVGARLAQRARYVGVEPDPISRATAQQRVPTVVADLSEVHETFDLVCAFEVLEHIEDDRGALKEWRERIRPGGSLMISVPAYAERFSHADEMAGHFRRYDPEALRALLADSGFDRQHVQTYGGPLGYVLEAARNEIGKRRNARSAEDIAERTSGSGRLLQPSGPLLGLVTYAGTAPFRLMQRPMTSRGTGLVAVARREREADDHQV